MKLIIDIDDETYKNVTFYGTYLCPRDKENLEKALKNARLFEGLTKKNWIPCSERQPDLSGYYLVTEKGAMEPDFVTVGCYYRGNTNLDDKWLKETGYPMEVTAWMELPEPYGGDDQ